MTTHLHSKTAKILMTALSCFLFLCSCSGSMQINSFIQSPVIRIQMGGSTQMSYDPLTCQISFSRDLKQFRVHTDNMSDFFCVTLSEIPVNNGQEITADLVWTTHRDVLTKNNLTFEALRLEGETIWLWSKSAKIGVCLKTLE